MELHEYQSKALFAKGGMYAPKGLLVASLADADAVLDQLTLPVVVKAQVHAGGRGKAGGIKLAKTREEAIAAIKAILGMTLRTKQTGEKGLLVRRVYVEQASSFRSELYLSILNDRATRNPILIASKAGGMDIEEVAEKTPDALLKLPLNINRGMSDHICRRVHYFWSDGSFAPKETAALLKALWQVYVTNDASMVEINPVAVTTDNRLMALDAKMSLDDNARFRHKDWDALDLADEIDPSEIEAAKFDLNYVKLDGGNIGCMVNGAGLAMATMDVIALNGAKPANFLDVGGGATAENVTAAFKILTSDPDVKVILVNIFGGIMKCDIIAAGILEACKNVELKVPLVVRLEGTRVEEGMALIRESKLNCAIAKDLSDAARQAVAKL